MQRGYLICATARSGSNYFCNVLASTGALGAPRGFFNTVGRQRDTPGYPEGRAEQAAWILQRGATANGVYGARVFPQDFADALQHGALSRLPDLSFVRLLRRDLLGQAISMARAIQTKQFKSHEAEAAQAEYSAAMIERMMVTACCSNMSWDIFFARTGLPATTIHYEDIEADPPAAVAQVAALVGVSPAPAIDPARITLRRQRDQLNEEWRERYVAEMGGLHFMQLMQPPT